MSGKLKKRVISMGMTFVMFICSVVTMNYADTKKVYAASSRIESALQWAVDIANDNSHGYSQQNRWGPDYDCSSFVISALKSAGIDTGNATYTGNMKSNLTAHGFKWIPWSDISNVSNLQRGDILLNEVNHTEFYLGNGINVAAHSSYGNTATGDQNGKEISVAAFYNYPWDGVLRYDESDSSDADHNPKANLESVTGGVGKINVTGWTFDYDDVEASLAMHVYIGGPAGQEGCDFAQIYADKVRGDVNIAFAVGNNHGFNSDIYTYKSGWQDVYVYSINKGQGNNVFIGSKRVYITPDTEEPVISDVSVSSVDSTGYTVTCKVTDNVNVDRVQFPTWTSYNGQDDINNNWRNDEYCSGKRDGNTFTFRVNSSDHNNENGEYVTHIYAYDSAGNYASTGVTVNVPERRLYAKMWVSDSKMGEEIYSASIGTTCYLCYMIYDSDTGNKTVQLDNVDYSVKETIYNPDGSVKHTYTYNNSTDNWIGSKLDIEGIYKMNVEITINGNTRVLDSEISVVRQDTIIEDTPHVHNYKSKVTKESTYTSTGMIVYTCDCGESYTETIPVKVCNHNNTSINNAKEMTCTEAGYTGDKYCNDCKKIISYGQKIEAKGHSYSKEWTIDKEATINEEGQKSHHCLNCGEITDITVIDKILPQENISQDNNQEDSKMDGLRQSLDGDWYLYDKGNINTDYTGLYFDETYGWWFINEGRIDFDYNDLWYDQNYGWWKVNGGTVDFGYTGLYDSPSCGWWLIGGGTVVFGYNDLWNDENCGWWKINGGAVDFDYTGLYDSPSCGWWLIGGGTVAFDYNDLWNDENCGWWKINGGAVDFGYTGLYGSPSCGWWLIGEGTVAFGYNDLWYDENYGLWKINGGTIDFEYAG